MESIKYVAITGECVKIILNSLIECVTLSGECLLMIGVYVAITGEHKNYYKLSNDYHSKKLFHNLQWLFCLQ